MSSCWVWHRWGPWVPIRAWDYTIEEWRICTDCGKTIKGDSWRVANREALLALHSEAVCLPRCGPDGYVREDIEF
jgi:hypothetical protein